MTIGAKLTDIDGNPLLYYTIRTAVRSTLKNIIVTTDYARSDIDKLGFGNKIEYIKRPKSLCTNEAPASLYIQHIIDLKDLRHGDSICLLQPTCPIRNVVDVNNAISKYKASDKKSLISVYKLGFLSKLYDSQGKIMKMKKEAFMYYRNSSIYIFDVGLFLETENIFEENPELFEMPSYQSIDIDTQEDFKHAELILKGGFDNGTIRCK